MDKSKLPPLWLTLSLTLKKPSGRRHSATIEYTLSSNLCGEITEEVGAFNYILPTSKSQQ